MCVAGTGQGASSTLANVQREPLDFGGLLNSVAENRIPKGRCWSMSNCNTDRGILEARAGYTLFGQRSGASLADVGWGFGYGKFSNDEQQKVTITGVPTGGTFTLTWVSPANVSGTTAAIPYNATAAQVQQALEDLAEILIGDVRVTGGPGPTSAWIIQFTGTYANLDVNLITSTSSLSGGTSPAITITEEVKGGLAEEYIAVIQKSGDTTATLYVIDPVSGVFTQVATGLNAGEWVFAQYSNKIYGVNQTQGMIAKTIGTSANATTTFSRPSRPALAPTAVGSTIGGANTVSTTGLSITGMSGWQTSNPTTSIQSTGNVVFTLTHDQADAQVTVDFEWSADQDFSRNDFIQLRFGAANGTYNDFNDRELTGLTLIDSSASTYVPRAASTNVTYAGPNNSRYFEMEGASRSERVHIRKFRVTFYIRLLSSGQTISIQPLLGYQWLNDNAPLNLDASPTTARIEYAYSYVSDSTGLESDLSPTVFTFNIPPANTISGAKVTITGAVNANLTSSDKLYFYRRDKKTGIFHRLPNADGTYGVANTGTPSIIDTFLESELADLPQFGDNQLGLAPSDFASPGIAIGTWHQCLVVGARRQAHLSWVGQPFRFAPSPDQTDAEQPSDTDLLRGRTDYVSDSRAEEVYGIAGQESLYAATSYSAYAMVGDSPAFASSFRRLPGSRGSVGYRASCGYGGGFEVGSQDGLWYYSVGRSFNGQDNGTLADREETAEVRRSWSDLLGGSYSGLTIAEYRDEIWVFNGAAFLCLTREKRWLSGTLQHKVKAICTNRERGFFFLSSTGAVYQMGTGAENDAGTDIAWEYETGWLETGREQIKGMTIQGTGTPKVEVWVQDGNNLIISEKTFTKESGKAVLANFYVAPGWRYKLRFKGCSSGDTIENVIISREAATSGSST